MKRFNHLFIPALHGFIVNHVGDVVIRQQAIGDAGKDAHRDNQRRQQRARYTGKKRQNTEGFHQEPCGAKPGETGNKDAKSHGGVIHFPTTLEQRLPFFLFVVLKKCLHVLAITYESRVFFLIFISRVVSCCKDLFCKPVFHVAQCALDKGFASLVGAVERLVRKGFKAFERTSIITEKQRGFLAVGRITLIKKCVLLLIQARQKLLAKIALEIVFLKEFFKTVSQILGKDFTLIDHGPDKTHHRKRQERKQRVHAAKAHETDNQGCAGNKTIAQQGGGQFFCFHCIF
ncbi:hypothetical protein Lgee_2137 [Legionella geestiana]|uniref:Uncharacterized protein n=1 Tax=Legionella geestiana TaxID=45065 RepID=A0A0W0TLH1_9GAMM|nr:hypothetical protein Lgee_2137 [Legionella geestiana]